MHKFFIGETVHIPMTIEKIEDDGKSCTLSYVDNDVEYSLTIDDWALEDAYYTTNKPDITEMIEQVELIVSSKVEVAKEKIYTFIKECHENNIDILGIEPIMSFTGVGKSGDLKGAIMVGAMIRYLAPLYSDSPFEE